MFTVLLYWAFLFESVGTQIFYVEKRTVVSSLAVPFYKRVTCFRMGITAFVICTLPLHIKLASLWQRNIPFWRRNAWNPSGGIGHRLGKSHISRGRNIAIVILIAILLISRYFSGLLSCQLFFFFHLGLAFPYQVQA